MTFIIIVGIIGGIILFFVLRYYIWVEPHDKISHLQNKIIELNKEHETSLKNTIDQYNEEIKRILAQNKRLVEKLKKRLKNAESIDMHIIEHEFLDIILVNGWQEISQIANRDYPFLEIPAYRGYIRSEQTIKEKISQRFFQAIADQYKYKYISAMYPEIAEMFIDTNVDKSKTLVTNQKYSCNLFSAVKILVDNNEEIERVKQLLYSLLNESTSNLKVIPYMAQIIADIETYGLEILAQSLEWGRSVERLKKVKSIREIRKDAQQIVEKNKESQYQLAYLLELYPKLQEVIDAEFNSLPIIRINATTDKDTVQDYLSRSEYLELSVSERNQLALERYKNSRRKSKWQVGRDYEQYVGYKYTQLGYTVDNFGTYMGLEDLGRDIIAKKGNDTLIIQCKYWSSSKQIHEKHITQLYGTMVSYCIENNIDNKHVKGVIVTNIQLSDTARKIANFLNIEYIENYQIGDYPCIKCNIGHDEYGSPTKIYHLPFDQQYDAAKIESKKGEFYATTVIEAEKAGFRRAKKWYGND